MNQAPKSWAYVAFVALGLGTLILGAEACEDEYERREAAEHRASALEHVGESMRASDQRVAEATDWHCGASGRCYADKWDCREAEGTCTAQAQAWCTMISRTEAWCGSTPAGCSSRRIEGETCTERR